ncbi:TlpA disulfide reductase family protein [Arachidicoccus terrestris]|uniref:TlpA disulfide reductase family protein n=1 Tax=Arachidicoccus terrestris TaxID=2875539 RepID=UPI001CC81991|nr:TlpA disulfide reductase family protein [Arachidicoccus terrestris]UAY55709.1 AhpC/TSA family protein [Arachidicoccus terrestris]
MKKISLMLLCTCALLVTHAQGLKYTITGTMDSLPSEGKIWLNWYDIDYGHHIDTVKMNAKGEFMFTGTVPRPELGQLLYRNGRSYGGVVFYLEDGHIHVTIKKEKRFAVVSGTPLNKDFNDYYIMMDRLLDSADAADHPAQPYTQFSKELKVPKLRLMQQFIPTHPNSLLALYQLYVNVARYPDEVSELVRLFNQLTPEVQETKEGKQMATLIRGLSANKVGDVALNFTLPDPTGKMVSLSDFRGKYVLLDFWATWCGPCLEEMPNVANAYRKYHDKNFEIIGVSLDRPDTKALWKKMIKDKHMDWVQVSDLKWWNSEAALLYNIQGVPANFLIDPEGKVIAVNLRGPALQTKLAEIFK